MAGRGGAPATLNRAQTPKVHATVIMLMSGKEGAKLSQLSLAELAQNASIHFAKEGRII